MFISECCYVIVHICFSSYNQIFMKATKKTLVEQGIQVTVVIKLFMYRFNNKKSHFTQYDQTDWFTIALWSLVKERVLYQNFQGFKVLAGIIKLIIY